MEIGMSTNGLCRWGDRRVTLEHLRAFVLVAESGGFHQAAQDLRRSQPAVTQSLKRLEEILDCRLVERRQGSILGLTGDGERFLPVATEILARMSEAVRVMRGPPIAGRVTLGVPDDVRIIDLNGAISRCCALNRSLRVEVTSALSSQLAGLLRAGTLDLAILKWIATDTEPFTQGRRTLLRTEPLHWIAKERRSFDTIRDLPLVLFPDGCCYREAAFQSLSRIGKPAYCAYSSVSYDNVRAAISAGLGIGVLPRSALGKDHCVLGETEGFPALPQVHLVLVAPSDRPVVRQFWTFLEPSVTMRVLQEKTGQEETGKTDSR